MAKNVLIVDDDRILIRLAQKKLQKFENVFSVITAEDGLQAVDKLKEQTISLVVTDLQMPKMDGFSLLAHLSENYPDIPVIVLTAYSTPASKKIVLEGGAAGFMEKPFVVDDLAQKIIKSLAKESEGGTLQTVPLEMFLQLVEMEQKTCTIRVTDRSTGQQGVLFLNKGELFDARIQDSKGLTAAYIIFSWEKVTLAIQDTCPVEKKQIDDTLQAILMEAMRLKDEAAERGDTLAEVSAPRKTEPPSENSTRQEPSPLAAVRVKIEKLKGERKWLKEIFNDNRWDSLIYEANTLGKLFQADRLRCIYLNCDEATDFILLPGKNATVISVSAQCPRDKIVQTLSA